MLPSGESVNWALSLATLTLGIVLGSASVGIEAQGLEPPPGACAPHCIVTDGPVTALAVTITGVTLGATSSVNFNVVDQNGFGYVGLPASTLEVTLAKLIPGTFGDDNAWQSYINTAASPTAGLGTGTQPTVEASTDSGGSLLNNFDGTYTYTFGTNISNVTQPIAVPLDSTLTHRVAIAIRSSTLPQAANAIYTWQPSTGATTGILTQDMVDSASCNSCHDHLSAHGGPRQDPRLCVTCHNPGSIEPNSGNTLDFKVMFHKLHDGINLPSVVAGTPYVIYGHGNSTHDYSSVVFPQDIRNCTKCHNPADTNTPDAARYASAPTIQACGACHDDVNFALGQAGGHAGGIMTDNSQCTICHAPNGFAGSVQQSHLIQTQVDAANFLYNIVDVTDTRPGQKPSVTFSVTNPNNNNAAYDIHADPAFTASGGTARLQIDLAWSNSDYENVGSGTYPGQPVSFNALTAVSNGDGTYTATSPISIPTSITGSGAVVIEGHPADTNVSPPAAIPVTSVVQYFAITDALPVPRRTIVSTASCKNCHGENDGLAFHGSNRNDNTQVCVVCHNPDATDLSERPTDPDGVANGINVAAADQLEQRTIDFKYMIHAIHGAAFRTDDFMIYAYGNNPTDFADVRYPGVLADCAQCHVGTTYSPPLAATDLGTTIDTHATVASSAAFGTQDFTPEGAVQDTALFSRITPTASACSSCHNDILSEAHMAQNGASFSITEMEIGATLLTTESCAICHAAGAIEDVAVAHGVH